MECPKYQEKLSDYIDGLLRRSERRELERHLHECSRCREIYDDLLHIRHLSRELPDYEPPPQLWDRIAAAIASEATASPRGAHSRRMWARPLLASAAAVIVAVGAFFVLRPFRSEPPPAAIPPSASWMTRALSHAEIQPTGLILIHKPTIDAGIVSERIEELERQIERGCHLWDAEVREHFQRHLDLVERSLAHCREELERNPEDPVSRELYGAALKAKLELLQRFSEPQRTSPETLGPIERDAASPSR